MTRPAAWAADSPAVPQETPDYGDLALVMTGGGARGAYQVGMLRYLARRFPELRIPILTGVSAGAVNAGFLAQHVGSFQDAVDELFELWLQLVPERVFQAGAGSLATHVLRTGLQLLSGGAVRTRRLQGMVDTGPLREYLAQGLRPVEGTLAGIETNLRRGRLNAVAISATSYTTGQSVIWVQGRDIQLWERPQRRSVHTPITLEHIMASTALPIFFPAVQVGREWYGDGGIRLTNPLSPALHLGAHKILAVATRYRRSQAEAARREVPGYPPLAQVLGVLYNAVFLDMIDQDVYRLERMNRLLRGLPAEHRDGMRVVDLLVLRPSRDLGRLARDYEPRLPSAFRFLSRGLGTRETRSPDLLSIVMFQPDYLRALIELGEADAEARGDEIAAFLANNSAPRGE